jgi:hypothetical protein
VNDICGEEVKFEMSDEHKLPEVPKPIPLSEYYAKMSEKKPTDDVTFGKPGILP